MTTPTPSQTGLLPGTRYNIHVSGRYKSISKLDWLDIPSMAVVTGETGSGKSQLLELIAGKLGAWYDPQRPQHTSPPEMSPIHFSQPAAVTVSIDGASYETGEAYYSRSEWRPIKCTGASLDSFKKAVEDLFDFLRRSDGDQPRRGHHNLDETLKRELLTLLGLDRDSALLLSTDRFFSLLTPFIFWKYLSSVGEDDLAMLFLAYRVLEFNAKKNGQNRDWISSHFGPYPWTTMNNIILASGGAFYVDTPELLEDLGIFSSFNYAPTFSDLRQLYGNFSIDGLSSGERAIMSMCRWQYDTAAVGKTLKFLVLDEPDAHLHPSLTRRFLSVLQSVFIEQGGARIIMSTHSPSTVALVPRECLFEMRRMDERRVIPAESKQSLIATLTDGFVAVREATRLVMVEGRSDPDFYLSIWQVLTETHGKQGQLTLDSYPNLLFVHGKGKEGVQSIVPQIRQHGFTEFFGITDGDTGNQRANGVYVLNRYAMENYLLDPLCVWFVLSVEGHQPSVSEVQLPRWRESDLSQCNERQLQSVADVIFQRVMDRHPFTSPDDLERKDVEFLDGKILRYPMWFLQSPGHDLMQWFREGCGHQFIRTEKLLAAHNALRMIPREIFDVMQAIQAGKP